MDPKSQEPSRSYNPILFILLNLADCVVTKLILDAGGREVMPASKHFIDEFGIFGLIAFKLIAASAALLLLHKYNKLNLLKYLNASMLLIVASTLGLFLYSQLGFSK